MLDPTTVAEFLKRLHCPGEIRRQPTENDLAGEFEGWFDGGAFRTETERVPRSIHLRMVASQRADPSCGRPQAMAEIPFEVVDCFLQVRLGERALAELANIPPATLNYLDSVYQRNQFKRGLPLCGP